MTNDPQPMPDGAGEVTSRSVPPAFNAEEGSEACMVEVDPSAAERKVDDQGGRTSPARRDPELQRLVSPVPMTSKSSGRV